MMTHESASTPNIGTDGVVRADADAPVRPFAIAALERRRPASPYTPHAGAAPVAAFERDVTHLRRADATGAR